MNYSKIEIAVEALIQAQKFHEASNFICAQILLGASQTIIKDLCKANGIQSSISDIVEFSGYEYSEVHNIVVGTYNKTKHADRDPFDTVFVSAENIKMHMEVAVSDLLRLDPNLINIIPDVFGYVYLLRKNKKL